MNRCLFIANLKESTIAIGRAIEYAAVIRQIVNGKKKMELLPGDKENLAIQTRGGPEKHEVTGWVLVSSQEWSLGLDI